MLHHKLTYHAPGQVQSDDSASTFAYKRVRDQDKITCPNCLSKITSNVKVKVGLYEKITKKAQFYDAVNLSFLRQ